MDTQSLMQYLNPLNEDAIVQTLSAWKQQHPHMGVCVMLPENEKDKVVLLQGISKRFDIPLVGAVFPALLKDGQFATQGAWLFGFKQMPWYELYEHLPTDQQEMDRRVEEIAGDIRRQIDHVPNITLFMLFDSMVPNVGSILDGLYLHLANRVFYAGGNAGSESFQPMPCLFDSQRFIQGGLLAILITQHKGAILEHGYQGQEKISYATSTQGNCISQIDWQPAFEVYQKLVSDYYGEKVTAQNFYQYGVHFPFGIMRANHHMVVRIPVGLAEDGSLFCVGEVPANSVLTLIRAPTVQTTETMQALKKGLNGLYGKTDGEDLLLFYCAGRRMHLGIESAEKELAAFHETTHAKQVAGALSLGEIGGSTLMGYPLFHNATLVAMRW